MNFALFILLLDTLGAILSVEMLKRSQTYFCAAQESAQGKEAFVRSRDSSLSRACTAVGNASTGY